MSNEKRPLADGSLHTTESGIHRTIIPPSVKRDGNLTYRHNSAAAPATGERKVSPGRKTLPAVSPRKLSSAEYNTALIHFYRGEVQRSNSWRNRLDTTTNWAVITAGATLSFAFGNKDAPHFVIIINSLLIAFFLFMEARRYRYYEIWSSRVRVIETGYLAPMLSPDDKVPDERWAEHLAADLLHPHFNISEWEAVGRRLRRNYLWIFALLASAWNLKVYLHPTPAVTFAEFLERARVGILPGDYIFAVGVVFNILVIMLALATLRLREATGEVLPHHDFSFRSLNQRVADWRERQNKKTQISRRMRKARQRVRDNKLDTTEVPNRGSSSNSDTSENPRARRYVSRNEDPEISDIPDSRFVSP